jgi:hypothetical protein
MSCEVLGKGGLDLVALGSFDHVFAQEIYKDKIRLSSQKKKDKKDEGEKNGIQKEKKMKEMKDKISMKNEKKRKNGKQTQKRSNLGKEKNKIKNKLKKKQKKDKR